VAQLLLHTTPDQQVSGPGPRWGRKSMSYVYRHNFIACMYAFHECLVEQGGVPDLVLHMFCTPKCPVWLCEMEDSILPHPFVESASLESFCPC